MRVRRLFFLEILSNGVAHKYRPSKAFSKCPGGRGLQVRRGLRPLFWNSAISSKNEGSTDPYSLVYAIADGPAVVIRVVMLSSSVVCVNPKFVSVDPA